MHTTQLFNITACKQRSCSMGKIALSIAFEISWGKFIEKIAFFEFLDIQNRERANNNERPDDLTHRYLTHR